MTLKYGRMYQNNAFVDIIGKTFNEVVDNNGEEIIFTKSPEGFDFKLLHNQDCCESVYIEDITGDLSDLVGTPILSAEESYESGESDNGYESQTWSFYSFRTIKGSVTIRFFGSSNGYYSESATLEMYGMRESAW